MKINKIVITGRLYKEMETSLDSIPSKEVKFLPENEVTEEILKWADAYVAFKPTANFDFYNIKWVHSLGAGVDGYLFNRKWKEEVILTRTICSFGERISQYCLSYILEELQKHTKFTENQKLNIWEPITPILLKEQNILIFGTGAIGQEVARTLSVLGAKTVGISLSGAEKQYFHEVIKLNEVKNYLPKTNWIINTLPLTKYTENIFNKDIFKYLKNANFINVGRGGSVDEDELVDAVSKGNITSAILDVFKTEPLPLASKLWNNPNIHITPHISAVTSVNEGIQCFVDTLNYIEKDEFPLKNKVDIKKGY